MSTDILKDFICVLKHVPIYVIKQLLQTNKTIELNRNNCLLVPKQYLIYQKEHARHVRVLNTCDILLYDLILFMDV